MTVQFLTDSSVTYPGFRAEWKAIQSQPVCDEPFTTLENSTHLCYIEIGTDISGQEAGLIGSPNYPDKYDDDTDYDLTTVITVAEGKRVKLFRATLWMVSFLDRFYPQFEISYVF